MKTKVEELPESRVRLDVEVPEADLKHAFEHAASDLAESLRLPGFRKGKAPLPVVVARVGREAVWQEALKSHLDAWFWSAAEDSGIRPVATPEVEFDGLPEDDGPFTFSATVAVLPKPEVADWTTLEVPAPEAEVPAEIVDAELERIRDTAAALTPVERPAQEGDTVVIDLSGESVPAQRDYVAEVGGERLVPELDQALVGMSAGETKTVELAAGDEKHPVELTVKEIKERVLPELDDEFAKDLGEFDTLDALRQRAREDLEHEAGRAAERQVRSELMKELATRLPFEVPASLVERELERRVEEFARGLVEQRVDPREAGIDWAALRDSQREAAREAVAAMLVLDEITRREHLTVTEEEIEREVARYAEQSGRTSAAVRAALEKDGGLARVAAGLRRSKSIDFALARATIAGES
jgi:trigger factor